MFDSRAGGCSVCAEGHYLDYSGSCELGEIGNCVTYVSEFECADCQAGFLLKGYYSETGGLIYKKCIVEPLISNFVFFWGSLLVLWAG